MSSHPQDRDPALVEVRGVSKSFGSHQVLHDVSLTLRRGRTTSLVGESGSGKSTIARIVTGLEVADEGQVLFDGAPAPRRGRAAQAHRRRMGVVLQDPYESMDPRFTVGEVVAEPLRAQRRYRATGPEKVRELLAACGLPEVDLDAHVHRFSGGQRQRMCVARALATDPDFVVCDEPTSALDVSVQAQILNLLLRLQQERGLAYLFITHDIEVVRRISDEVAVMHHGRIVEAGPVADVTGSPRDPYTQRLLSAVLGTSPHTRKLSGPGAVAIAPA
jgi:ABC-type glutathione transport system ATPase component